MLYTNSYEQYIQTRYWVSVHPSVVSMQDSVPTHGRVVVSRYMMLTKVIKIQEEVFSVLHMTELCCDLPYWSVSLL